MRSVLLSLFSVVALVVSTGTVQAQRGFRGGTINFGPSAHPSFNNSTFVRPSFNVAPGGMVTFNNSRFVNPRVNAASTAQLSFNNSLIVNRQLSTMSPFHQNMVLFPNNSLAVPFRTVNNAALFPTAVPSNSFVFPSTGFNGSFSASPFVLPSSSISVSPFGTITNSFFIPMPFQLW